ncbi:I78 family peptidase inhibitor [Luteimonas sp. RIT-PG2_3]
MAYARSLSRASLACGALAVLMLAACQPTTPPAEDAAAAPATEAATVGTEPAEAVPAPDDAAATCNAEAVQALVGQEATAATVEQAVKDSGAAISRVLKPGDAATMDFRQDRLDIATDDKGLIQSLRCG